MDCDEAGLRFERFKRRGSEELGIGNGSFELKEGRMTTRYRVECKSALLLRVWASIEDNQ